MHIHQVLLDGLLVIISFCDFDCRNISNTTIVDLGQKVYGFFHGSICLSFRGICGGLLRRTLLVLGAANQYVVPSQR